MRSILLISIFLILASTQAYSQDLIFTTKDKVIMARNVTIVTDHISYQLMDGGDQAIHRLPIDKIQLIKYESGEIRTFGKVMSQKIESLLRDLEGASISADSNFLILGPAQDISQDLIFTTKDKVIMARNVTIVTDHVSYQLMDGGDQAIHRLPIDKIQLIKYESGKIRTFGIVEGKNIERLLRNLEGGSINADSNIFRNQTLELYYTVIPSSTSHGVGLHVDFAQFPKKKTIWRIPIGFGGGYAQSNYVNHQFSIFTTNVSLRRIYAHGTLGFRLQHRQGGVTLRAGYNFMYGMYEYEFLSAEASDIFEPEQNKLLHRVHLEAVVFKSFSKKKPNVGVFGGVQYLITPKKDGEDLLIIKAGIGF